LGGVLIAVGAATTASAIAMVGRRAGQADQPTVPDEARKWQTQLHYLQAFTTGYSGTLQLPAGAQLQASTARQLTELPLALPDLVDRYRDFAERAALWYRPWYRPYWPEPTQAGRVVIGIDELDKIGTAEACERFINDIKAIFGIPHCLYLVSVSEDALASFEQPAFAARTAFDNAFDEVIRVSYLDFGAARTLLRSRVAGLPTLMIALCHVLSGGLPRDLIRNARSMINANAEGRRQITPLSEVLVKAEIDALKSACLTELAGHPDQLEHTGLLPRLLDAAWPGQSCTALLHALDRDFAASRDAAEFLRGAVFLRHCDRGFRTRSHRHCQHPHRRDAGIRRRGQHRQARACTELPSR